MYSDNCYDDSDYSECGSYFSEDNDNIQKYVAEVRITNKFNTKSRSKNNTKLQKKNPDVYLYCGKGSRIVNAITGIRSNDKIGSLKENLYFSVIDSRSVNHNKEPYTFYFDSPEQYEKFMFDNLNVSICVSSSVKSAWTKKKIETMKKFGYE